MATLSVEQAGRYDVGILCHGQLAMMTGEAANKLKIPTVALGPGDNSPASHAIDVVQGNFNEPADVVRFVEATRVKSLVLDTDHVNKDVFKELAARGIAVNVYPDGEKIARIQHRRSQKEMFEVAGIPLAPWMPAVSEAEYLAAFKTLGSDVIVKKAKDGFDGRGNAPARTERQLKEVFHEFNRAEVVIEQRLPFEKEIAMMAAQDTHGNRALYPTVQTVHKDGMLDRLYLPALVNPRVEQQAVAIAHQVLDVIGDGLVGIEFFVTKDDIVRLNEVAGRPHNSGHYTIEACESSQFDALMRIAHGKTLSLTGTTLTHPDQMVLMRNLNGGTKEEVSDLDFRLAKVYGADLHWYHKTPRPLRKRGHMTLIGSNRKNLSNNASAAIRAMHFFA